MVKTVLAKVCNTSQRGTSSERFAVPNASAGFGIGGAKGPLPAMYSYGTAASAALASGGGIHPSHMNAHQKRFPFSQAAPATRGQAPGAQPEDWESLQPGSAKAAATMAALAQAEAVALRALVPAHSLCLLPATSVFRLTSLVRASVSSGVGQARIKSHHYKLLGDLADPLEREADEGELYLLDGKYLPASALPPSAIELLEQAKESSDEQQPGNDNRQPIVSGGHHQPCSNPTQPASAPSTATAAAAAAPSGLVQWQQGQPGAAVPKDPAGGGAAFLGQPSMAMAAAGAVPLMAQAAAPAQLAAPAGQGLNILPASWNGRALQPAYASVPFQCASTMPSQQAAAAAFQAGLASNFQVQQYQQEQLKQLLQQQLAPARSQLSVQQGPAQPVLITVQQLQQAVVLEGASLGQAELGGSSLSPSAASGHLLNSALAVQEPLEPAYADDHAAGALSPIPVDEPWMVLG
ncbi:unnamed protein product [Chrysoparadoxa australica]